MEAAESLSKRLEQISDPRRTRGVRHPFEGILRLTLLGYGLRPTRHGPIRPLRRGALAGAEGALGV